MAFEQIRYDTADGIVTITLNRPEKLNAVTNVLIRELIAAFDAADVDDAARVVIVTGAGRAFCAGADLSAGTTAFDGAQRGRPAADGEHRDGGGLVALRIYDMKKPVIAYVAGLSAPKGRRMGHAGAIISAFGESAQEKVVILENAGVAVAPDPSSMGATVAGVLRKMGLAA